MKRALLLGMILTSPAMAVARAADDDGQPAQPQARVIRLEARVLEFAPTRDDLAVGTAVLNLLGAKTFKLNDEETENRSKEVELKEVGRNRFELPALELEFHEQDGGYLCMSVKVWFDKLANEFDSWFYENGDDRYALVSYCTEHADGSTRPRFGQNRVASLEQFKKTLTQPFVIRLNQRRVPSPGIAVDREGALFALCFLLQQPLAERHQLWKLNPDRRIERMPLVGPRTAPWRIIPHAPTVGGDGALYLSGLQRLSAGGEVSPVPYPSDEPAQAPDTPVAADLEGNLYFGSITPQSRDSPRMIRLARLDRHGKVHVVAGSTEGHQDGTAGEARFVEITAIAIGPSGGIHVADGRERDGSWIRRIRDGNVTTIAGSDKVEFADGKGAAGRFRIVSALSVARDGNVYVADRFNAAIRKVDPHGEVTTIAGRGTSKHAAGLARDASFADPAGVAVGPDGDVFVLDCGRKEAWIRRISRDGKIATLAVLR